MSVENDSCLPPPDKTPDCQEDEIAHKCGIGGIYTFEPGEYDITQASLSLLYSSRNRGQEGAGGFFTNGWENIHHARSGMIPHVFYEEKVAEIKEINPNIAIVQNRYSTSGLEKGAWQPIKIGHEGALAHNGNLTNAIQLEKMLPEDLNPRIQSDSWIVAKLIERAQGTMQQKIATISQQMEGAYSMVLLDQENLYAIRDPWGFRPLSIGILPDGKGFVVTSETASFEPLQARYIRDVREGEGVVINKYGIQSFFLDKRIDITKHAHCIFEIFYFGWPDSIIFGRHVMDARMDLGATHARLDLEQGFIPDVICGVDKSGRSYAHGYARTMREEIAKNPRKYGISYKDLYKYMHNLEAIEALVRNEYVPKRAFIAPEGREAINNDKHRADPLAVQGKRVVVIDDSIVRNKTIRPLLNKLKRAGADEVHVRIMCPPIIDNCYMGIDMAKREELIAYRLGVNVDLIRQEIGADSLRYSTHAQFLSAATDKDIKENGWELYRENEFCGGCFTSHYPDGIDIRGVLGKNGR